MQITPTKVAQTPIAPVDFLQSNSPFVAPAILVGVTVVKVAAPAAVIVAFAVPDQPKDPVSPKSVWPNH